MGWGKTGQGVGPRLRDKLQPHPPRLQCDARQRQLRDPKASVPTFLAVTLAHSDPCVIATMPMEQAAVTAQDTAHVAAWARECPVRTNVTTASLPTPVVPGPDLTWSQSIRSWLAPRGLVPQMPSKRQKSGLWFWAVVWPYRTQRGRDGVRGAARLGPEHRRSARMCRNGRSSTGLGTKGDVETEVTWAHGPLGHGEPYAMLMW